MNKELTIIISFLNEKEEVRNTVKSLRENSDQDFEIMLINDCSTDGYDYKKIAMDFHTHYIEHSQRMGVAASRDEGVGKCNTEYFLFLDAHMRVYQKDWVDILVRELKYIYTSQCSNPPPTRTFFSILDIILCIIDFLDLIL